VSTPDPADIARLRTVVDDLAQAAQSVKALVEDVRADAARRGIDEDTGRVEARLMSARAILDGA